MARSTAERAGAAGFALVCAGILALLVVPTLLVVPMSLSDSTDLRFPPAGLSLRWYKAYFADREWIDATLFSLVIAAWTMAVSTVLGTASAVALARGRFPGREVAHALVLAPLIVPHILVAIALYLQFAPLRLAGTTLGFVLAHTVLALPYVVITVTAALSRLDPTLELAALNLGASRLRAFWEVAVPLILPGIAASAVFAFLSSFDETVVSFFLSGVENKTLTRKMFEDIDFNMSPLIAAVSTLVVLVTVAAIGLAHLLRTRLPRSDVETETQPIGLPAGR